MQVRFDHCVIHVSNWERSNKFYKDVLGAEVIKRGSGWAYRIASVQLNCHGPGVEASPLAQHPVIPGNSDLCFEWVGTVDEVLIHLKQYGIEVELGPINRSGALGQGMSVYFRDPDGSLLEFIVYPKS
jgi:catechol 2,3-dioxygenase-like lactoylglutathione lyase family enzyme